MTVFKNWNKEKKLVWLWILILQIILLIPYFYGYLTSPDDKYFTGLIGQNGHDQAFYLGWGAKQAENGNFLFEDKYNGDVDRRLVFNPLWLLMGLAAKLFSTSVISVFHVERVLTSIALLLVAYKIFSRFIVDQRWRIFALVLVSISSGFGYFTLPLDTSIIHSTPDLWVIESNIFLITLWEVLLPAGTTLFLIVMYWGYKTFFIDKRYAIQTGLLALLLGTVYPYAIISVYMILGACALFKMISEARMKEVIITYLKIFTISVPVLLYNGYLVLTNDKLTVGQALYESPNLLQYIIGYGIVSIFAIAGIILTFKQQKKEYSFLLIWVIVTFIQIYLPLDLIPFQMQLIVGIQIPLVILAVYALSEIGNSFEEKVPKMKFLILPSMILLLGFSSITNIYHYNNVFEKIKRHTLSDYIDVKTKEAIDWLDKNTEGNQIVLSSTPIAPYIPVLANNRMYCSDYNAPTADFPEKSAKINWLFNKDVQKTDQEIVAFLSQNKIDYIFYDPGLHALGGQIMKNRIDNFPQIQSVFDNGSVSILKYNRSL